MLMTHSRKSLVPQGMSSGKELVCMKDEGTGRATSPAGRNDKGEGAAAAFC